MGGSAEVRDRLTRETAFAAVVALPFALALAVFAVARPPDASQRHAADPLIQLFEGRGDVWVVVGAAVLAAAGWWRHLRIERRDLAFAAAGAAVAVIATVVLRAAVGRALPSFIPTEESAGPGLTNGLAAGVFEEVVFRIAVLPAIAAIALRRFAPPIALAIAVVATGALFSLSHELGPAGDEFDPEFMLTRFVVPGVVMSVVAIRVHVGLIVSLHCSAHLVIPFLFV